MKKKSQHEIRERARNHKKDYVEIHTEPIMLDLMYKKDYTDKSDIDTDLDTEN